MSPVFPGNERYKMELQAASIHPETYAEAKAFYLSWRAMEDVAEQGKPISREHQHAISTIQTYNIASGFYVNWDTNSYASVQAAYR